MPSRPDQTPQAQEVTPERLARYDRPGPRYTSYPTAVEFSQRFDAGAYEERLADADTAAGDPLSVYVHLPFCEARCLFCGCNVVVTPHHDRALPYLDLLRRELDLVAARLPHRRTLSQLHLGGGTPTYFAPDELAGFVRDLLDRFEPGPGAELAFEADPRATSPEHVAALAELGFNRLSMGVQDLDPDVQRAIARVQSLEQTRTLIEQARRHGFEGINVDLIYGLPHQRPERFGETVDAVIELGADRAAVYSFAWVPWLHAHQRRLPEDDMPAREAKYELFVTARRRFLEAGFEAIGMDHFARPGDELARARREGRLSRNFQGYTVLPATDVVGLGISAIGDLAGAYVQNEKKLSRYRAAVLAGRLPVERGVRLDADDLVRRELIRELMCNFRIEPQRLEARHGIDFATCFAEDLRLLAPYQDDGLVHIAPERITVTPAGEPFVRNLAMCFDRYLRDRAPAGRRAGFSRTV